jgi:hypothetical protein
MECRPVGRRPTIDETDLQPSLSSARVLPDVDSRSTATAALGLRRIPQQLFGATAVGATMGRRMGRSPEAVQCFRGYGACSSRRPRCQASRRSPST